MKTRICLLLGALFAGRASADEGPKDAVVVVLDASGSMGDAMRGIFGEDKMTAAKRALKAVLGKVPTDTHVGLLVFSGAGLTDDWVYPLGPVDRNILFQRIDAIRPDGGTPLGEYIKKGADRLLAARTEQFGYGTYKLLVVTDGEAGDQNLVDAYAPDVVSRGLFLDVIGVAMESEHTLAKMAHAYRRADDPASFERAVQAALAEITAKTAADAPAGQSAFDVIAGVEPEVAVELLRALAGSGNHPIGEAPASGNPNSPQAPGRAVPPSAACNVSLGRRPY